MSKRQPKHILSAALLLAALAVWSTPAFAEAGDGVVTDNFMVKLYADLYGGVNTNLFYLSQDEQKNASTFAGEFRLVPGLQLRTRNPESADLHLDVSLGLNIFAGASPIVDQSGISTTIAGGVSFNPKGSFVFHLDETFTRTNEAPNQASDYSFNRIMNRIGATASIVPGDGVFQGHLSYHNNLTFYNVLPTVNNMRHDLLGRFVWQFYPRTAAFLSADWRIQQYFSATRGGINDTTGYSIDAAKNVNSKPLRLTGGLKGLITRGLAVHLQGGYAWAWYDEGPSYEGIIGEAGLTYHYGTKRRDNIGVHYRYGFEDSILGSFYTAHTITAKYNQHLGDRFTLGLQADVSPRTYQFPGTGQVGTSGGAVVSIPTTLTDLPITLTARGDYIVRKWLTVGADYKLTVNQASSNVGVISAGTGEIGGRSFVQNIFLVRARFLY